MDMRTCHQIGAITMATIFAPRHFSRYLMNHMLHYMDQQTLGVGVISDLSLGGCRVVGDAPISKGTLLTLRISLPNHAQPIQIDQAVVRWAHQQSFGVEFLRIATESRPRLIQVVRDLTTRPYATVNLG